MRKTTEVDRESITQALEISNNPEESLHEAYSGRGMYGATCFGISGDLSKIIQFFIELAHIDYALAVSLSAIGGFDSLGRDMVMYFPHHVLTPEE